jgi:hypothetical protein
MMLTNSLFQCDHTRLHTLSPPPTLREANHDQLVAHHRNMEAANADKIAPRFGADQDDADGFFEHACYWVLEYEDRWQQCGLVWAWVDERPDWVSPVNWGLWVLEKTTHPMTRTFRMTLLGGGQITVREQFERSEVTPEDEGVYCHEPKLRVTADAGNGLQRFSGILENTREPPYGYTRRSGAIDALLIPPQRLFADRLVQLVTLAAHYHLPVMYADRGFAEAGGLMNGTNLRDQHRQVGVYAGRVLKGESPSTCR